MFLDDLGFNFSHDLMNSRATYDLENFHAVLPSDDSFLSKRLKAFKTPKRLKSYDVELHKVWTFERLKA